MKQIGLILYKIFIGLDILHIAESLSLKRLSPIRDFKSKYLIKFLNIF